MLAWLRRHYPKAALREGRAPKPVRGAFEAYFRGDASALGAVPWRAYAAQHLWASDAAVQLQTTAKTMAETKRTKTHARRAA